MYVVTGVEFIFFDKSLNFVCKNSKLKNESINPGLPTFLAKWFKCEKYNINIFGNAKFIIIYNNLITVLDI